MPTPTYLDSRSQLPFLQYGSLRALPQNDSKPRALPDYGWLRRACRCRHRHPRLASLGHRGHTSCAGSGAGCVRGAQSTEGTRPMCKFLRISHGLCTYGSHRPTSPRTSCPLSGSRSAPTRTLPTSFPSPSPLRVWVKGLSTHGDLTHEGWQRGLPRPCQREVNRHLLPSPGSNMTEANLPRKRQRLRDPSP